MTYQKKSAFILLPPNPEIQNMPKMLMIITDLGFKLVVLQNYNVNSFIKKSIDSSLLNKTIV